MAKRTSKPATAKSAKGGTSPARSRTARREVEAPAPEPLLRFDDIIGHERPIGILTSALTSKRVHHAWLFAGPSGVGKRTAARAFASLLLDPTLNISSRGEVAVDPASPTQALIRAGAHPDLHQISKEHAVFSRHQPTRDSKQRTLAIEVLREFVIEPADRTAAMPAGLGSLASKVFIVDEADFAADAGQNAMLKTLEEPPPGTVIILITSAPNRLLPTIRSRCQTLVFAPLATSLMDQWLSRRGLELDASQQGWLRAMAEGSPGEAMRIINTGVLEWQDALERPLDDALRGGYVTSLAPTMANLIDAWATARTKENPDASKEAARHAATHLMIRAIAARLRHHVARADNAPSAACHADALERLHEAQRQIDSNVQPIFVIDAWLAGLAR